MITHPSLIIAMLCLTSISYGQARGVEELPTLTVCEAIQQRVCLDGKLVAIAGTAEGRGEGAWLVDRNCASPAVTKGFVWPASIALESPSTPPFLHDVDFMTDRKEMDAADKRIKQLRREISEGRFQIMYVAYSRLGKVSNNMSVLILPENLGGLGSAT